jgi:hypothetical protein
LVVRARGLFGAVVLRRARRHPSLGLSDEEQILAAKYLPRDLPPRLFEEERFLFPESYHVNRVRLLVKDPDWIFAYWDVDPKALEEIGKSVGERSMALARLSLRVSIPSTAARRTSCCPWARAGGTCARTLRRGRTPPSSASSFPRASSVAWLRAIA